MKLHAFLTQLYIEPTPVIAMNHALSCVRKKLNFQSLFSVIGTSTSKSAVIVSATSSWRYSSSMVVAKSHDGGLKTHINNCFHSKDKHNGWAEYQIELSTVRAVGVLNRQSLAGQ